MKGKDLLLGMGYVDEALLQDTGSSRRTKAPVWQRWGAMAACAVILFGAAALLPRLGGGEEGAYMGAASPSSEAQKEYAAVIEMNRIAVNELTSVTKGKRRWYDPAEYDHIEWEKSDILRYYGRELAPAYVPEGLFAAQNNGNAQAVAKKDGTVVYDTVWLQYYHDYYADGGAKDTEDVAAHKGFTILASKLGMLSDCCYVLPEDEVKSSPIGGTEVTVGYRQMEYGPYDPQTHEGAGWYDLYVVSFSLDGTKYEITSHQMELEEILKVAASIITGSDDILVKDAQ